MEGDDELRRHLGTLWKTAMVGLGTVREVVVRSTQSGKLRLDIALVQRERSQNLEQLGEMVFSMFESHDIDLPEPMVQLCLHIRELSDRLRSDNVRASDNAFGAPRGFEPEAASDYGDNRDDEPEAFETTPAAAEDPETAPSPPAAARAARKPRKRNNSSRRKATT